MATGLQAALPKVPGTCVGGGLEDWVKGSMHEVPKLVANACKAGALGAEAGKASDVAQGFRFAGGIAGDISTGIQATGGLAASAVGMVRSFDRATNTGEVVEYLKGVKGIADTTWCIRAGYNLVDSAVGGFGPTADAVNGYVGAGAGLASPVLGIAINSAELARREPAKPADEELEALDDVEKAVTQRRYELAKTQHNAENNKALFKLLKNIAQLAMAVIGVVGLIIGAFMSAPIAAIVTITLSVSAIALSIISYIFANQADRAKEAKKQAIKQEEILKAAKEHDEVDEAGEKMVPDEEFGDHDAAVVTTRFQIFGGRGKQYTDSERRVVVHLLDPSGKPAITGEDGEGCPIYALGVIDEKGVLIVDHDGNPVPPAEGDFTEVVEA